MTRILVVDDDQDICRALMLRLKGAGYDVSIAHDGLGGMTAAVRDRPDLAILDISMPAGDGFSLADRMQRLPETAGTPIIFATASRRPGLRQKAREVHAHAFIEKPFVAAEVLTAIELALKRKQPACR